MEGIIDQSYLGNRVIDYLICLGIYVGGYVALKIFELIIIARMQKYADKTKTGFDDFVVTVIKKIAMPLAYYSIFYTGIKTLVLGERVMNVINIFGVALLTIFTARLLTLIVNYGITQYWSSRRKDIGIERSLSGIIRVVKLIIWTLAICFFLDNLGFKISAVIAGLGIGGVAVALAAQAVLGDLFSHFAILFDRPFEIGDFIIVGDFLGSVDRIGIKTTRINSLSGEQVIFSNTDLTNSRVRNYKRMEKRRVVFKIGVTYQTSLAMVKAIPGIVKKIIEDVDDTIFDRAHFFSYGDFSLVYEIVYYVIGNDYNKYMDIQQIINFTIKEEFEKQKIEFAYPTQTLFVEKS